VAEGEVHIARQEALLAGLRLRNQPSGCSPNSATRLRFKANIATPSRAQ